MKKFLFPLTCLLSAFNITKAQIAPPEIWQCGMDSSFHAQMINDTGYQNAMFNYNNSVFSQNNVIAAPAPYIVPVVFHVVSSNSLALSYDQIKWQLARLNASFKNQLVQFMGTPAGPQAVNTQIEFRLACIAQPSVGNNWTNNSEPGVMRYVSNDPNVLNQLFMDPSSMTALANVTHATPATFPFTNYLNIWCVPNICQPPCNQVTPTIIGYGTFPWQNAVLDGIVMRIDCIGSNSYPNNFPMFSQLNAGTVFSHEAGHFLGLYHTFETNINFSVTAGPLGCYGTNSVTASTDGDFIYDTPPTAIAGDLGIINVINSCNENYAPYGLNPNENDQLENFMCYSDDNKLNTFTANQSTRMQFAFNNPGPRYNLNTNANLVSTGVLNPSPSCLSATGILTGIFNYSIMPGANCNNVPVQFTNPTSIGFTAISWQWNFGDGNTGTGSNPVHTFTVFGQNFPVTCTVSDGVSTAVYTQVISTNFISTIESKTQTVCRGTEQTVYINFPANIPSVIMTDGVNQITIPNYNVTNAHKVAFTFIVNASASYSLLPAVCNGTNLGVATFSVMECCSNIINNGDFNSGNLGFVTELAHGIGPVVPNTNGAHYYYGTYTIQTPGAPGFVLPAIGNNVVNPTGPAMYIDGFSNGFFGATNGIVNIPPSCSSSQKPIIWKQVVNGLMPNRTYCYSFKVTENLFSLCTPPSILDPLTLETSMLSGPGVFAVSIQSIVPILHGPGYDQIRYLVYNYTFVTSPIVNPATNFTISINQVKNFRGAFYDFLLDDIALREMSSPIQAATNQTICAGNSVQLGIETNCAANAGAFNFAWTPTIGLSCSTCSNPIANPTITTIYTLVATPTVNVIPPPPSVITTVTLTVIGISPTITTNSSVVCLGNSATLTAIGLTNYTWFPGALLGSSVIVTPTANTIYTVIANNFENDCPIVKSMVAINISSLSNLSFNYPVSNSCPEKTFSATANCNLNNPGYFITWNFGDGGIGNGVYATHTYTANGQYTVTLTVSVPGTFTQTFTQTITVITNFNQPGISIFPATSTICPGSSMTLFGVDGQGGYTWLPMNVNAGFISVTPSITTTYTAVSTNTNGCVVQNTAVVIVDNEPLQISLSNSFICIPTGSTAPTVTLSLSPPGTYTIQYPPPIGLASPFTNSVVLNPTVTSSYTVYGFNITGCPKTEVITVGVVPCACLSANFGTLSGVVNPVTILPNTGYKVVGNMTLTPSNIGGPPSFFNNEITVYPGVQIYITDNAAGVISIEGSYFHGCGEMWEGIVLPNKQTQLNIIPINSPYKTSLIEDAKIAVNVLNSVPFNTTSPIPAYVLNVDNATFNKNIISIRIDSYPHNDVNTRYRIQNTLITSRSLPITPVTNSIAIWPNTNTIKTSTTGNGPMQTPYINDGTYPPVFITSVLYNYAGFPFEGIELNGVGTTSIASPNPYKNIEIGQNGPDKFNCFDNLRIDIMANNSNLIVTNSVFQNGQRHIKGDGKGIVAISNFKSAGINRNSIKIIAGGGNGNFACRFYEKTASVDITDYLFTEISDAKVYSFLNDYNQFFNFNTFGGLGFNIQTNRYKNVILQNNKLYNIKNAMLIGLNNNLSGGREVGQISVQNNIVDRYIGAIPAGSLIPYINVGLAIFDPVASPGGLIFYNPVSIDISQNVFTKVNNGINVMNLSNSPVGVHHNTVTMLNESLTYSNSPTQKGIFVGQCLKRAGITQNIITGPFVWGDSLKGIMTVFNSSLSVRCNTAANTARAIEFNGIQTTDFFEDNHMNVSNNIATAYGLVLDHKAKISSTSTVIGSPSRPTNNVWNGTWSVPSYKTLTEGGSSAQNSKLYVQYAPSLDPDGGGFTSGVSSPPLPELYFHSGITGGIITLLPANISSIGCRIGNGNGNGGGGGGNMAARLLLEQAVTNGFAYNNNISETQHIDKTNAYRGIKANPIIMAGSPILTNFYNTSQTNYLQAQVSIEENLANNNIVTVQSQIAALTPANVIETNYKIFYQTFKKMKDSTYNSNDSLNLISLANMCPYVDGAVVFQARALYNIIYDGFYRFYDNCNPAQVPGGRTTNVTDQKEEKDINVILKSTLFPNPNDGNYTLKFSKDVEKQSVEISIFDITGKQLSKESKFLESGNELNVSNNLLNGTYLVKVKLEGGTIDVHRLIISK